MIQLIELYRKKMQCEAHDLDAKQEPVVPCNAPFVTVAWYEGSPKRLCTNHHQQLQFSLVQVPVPMEMPMPQDLVHQIRRAIRPCLVHRCLEIARHAISWMDRTVDVCDAHLWGVEDWAAPPKDQDNVFCTEIVRPQSLVYVWKHLAFRDLIDRELYNMAILDPQARERYRLKKTPVAAKTTEETPCTS